jgi:4-amino-4-deoxy-L-arabinose transferase-like glycosyltransferase
VKPAPNVPDGVPARASQWRDTPLLACLAVQAFFLTFRLGALSMWTDELGSLGVVRQSVPAILRFVAVDIHPPLYFVMLHFWLKLPLGGDPAVRMRLLSVLCALAATVAVDLLWARRLPAHARLWFLALWATSPCLLLYSRMARSYSLQLLVVTVAACALWRLIGQPGRRAAWIYAAALALVLYTHYIPGVALGATGALLLAQRRRWRDLLLSSGLALAAYLPWLAVLAGALWKWAHQTGVYALSRNSVLEMALKVVFGCISFSLGESIPDWALISGVLLSAPLAWLIWVGLRKDPALARLVVPMALVAFTGVARWVPFHGIPARLLFLFPFFLILLASARESHPRAATAILAVLALLSCTGVRSYFERRDFLNKGYAMPLREIAAQIGRTSVPGRSLVLVDGKNIDALVFQHYLGPGWNMLFVTAPESLTRAEQLASDPRIERIWYLRNTHDVTPGLSNDRLERALTSTWIHGTRQGYLPFSPLQGALAYRLGMPTRPSFFAVLLDLRR